MFGGFSLHFQYAIKSKSRGWFFKSLKRLLTGVAESISILVLTPARMRLASDSGHGGIHPFPPARHWT